MPYRIVGVRFKRAGKIYYFDPASEQLSAGDGVIVETSRGIEYGQVVIPSMEIKEEDLVAPLKPVIRKVTEEDKQKLLLLRRKEEEAFQICLEKIAKHGLPMKLVDVEKTFDESKIIFYFTAEGRIDFRELVKDLAAVFHTRIELRQIGVRDEAKMIGGMGCCGRELCCASWLSDFVSVSIRMAKDQNLSLNPTKISGVCGRLMCCLKYENDLYESTRQEHPGVGARVNTPDGEGKVISVNIFKKTLTVELKESKMPKEYPFQNVSAKNAGSELDGNGDSQTNGGEDSRITERPPENKKTAPGPRGGKQSSAESTGPCLRT